MKLGELLLHCLYPNRCPGCREVIMPDMLLCNDCGSSLPRITDKRCKRCFNVPDKCSCRTNNLWFRRACAPFEYDGAIAQSLLYMKHYPDKRLVRFFAKNMAEQVAERYKDEQLECVIPVPMYSSRRRQRGFNQSQLLAREISAMLCLPYEGNVLVQRRKTRVQHKLSFRERKLNVKGAYALAKSVDEYRSVLLVDDIITSGASCSECAKALVLGGVKRVCCVAAARS